MGMSGVLLIIGSSLSIQSSSQFLGNIVAFIMPISFAVLIVIVRKYPKVNMVPSQFIAGVFLGVGFSAYVFAMYHTTVANTLFIISTEMIFLALFGYVFLKEKINLVTFISIIMGMSGVLLIIGSSLSIQSSSQFFGNIIAFIMPISFAVLIVIVRKYPKVDMVPAQFIAGVFAALIGYLVAGKLSISSHDLFLGFLAGTFQIGFGFIMITIGSQTTPAAVVGILMLTEAVFGPLWAWLFINEIPPISVIIGGSIIISAILFEFFFSRKKE